jgi:divalent metal cation (Fe/Co/Zn/Cd) transporter
MSFASIEVIQFSMVDIINGINGNKPNLEVGMMLYVILFIGIILKLALFIYCRYVNLTAKNDMLEALAEDHFNDVISNFGAVVTAAIAFETSAWWVDPGGAILISVIIIFRWAGIMTDQVRKIVGHTAPPHFIVKVEEIARLHDSRLAVDCTRAYHFGARYNVEMEIVLPGSMTVIDSHDIALALQHKIEAIVDVERAFVHVDHQERDGLEHKVERELVRSNSSKVEVTGDSTSVQKGSHSELRVRRSDKAIASTVNVLV